MKHLNDEIILSWINGDLPNDQVTEVKKHVDDCNTCLLRFSVLMKSHQEITGKSFETAPSKIINDVRSNLGLEVKEGLEISGDIPPGQIPILHAIEEKPLGGRFFASLTERGPALYSVAAAILLLVVMLPIFMDDSAEEGETFKDRILKRVQLPKVVSPHLNEEMAGIQLSLENNILKITQPIRFQRELKVYSDKGDLILETEFTDAENSFKLAMGNAPSIRVIISSLDKIIIEKVISQIQEQ